MFKTETIPLERQEKSIKEEAIQCSRVDTVVTEKKGRVYTEKSVHSKSSTYGARCNKSVHYNENNTNAHLMDILYFHKNNSVHPRPGRTHYLAMVCTLRRDDTHR